MGSSPAGGSVRSPSLSLASSADIVQKHLVLCVHSTFVSSPPQTLGNPSFTPGDASPWGREELDGGQSTSCVFTLIFWVEN